MDKLELENSKYYYSLDSMEVMNFLDHINEMLRKHTNYELEFGEGGDGFENVILYIKETQVPKPKLGNIYE